MHEIFTEGYIDTQAFSLLQTWCDALCSLQTPEGGFLCPACGRQHGRSHEAVYPLLYAAHRTGSAKYLNAALRAFRFGSRLLQPDGSMLNDVDSDWTGVTVFAAVALRDALCFHGELLPVFERAAWEERLYAMGSWICRSFYPEPRGYINYSAAAACALALLGRDVSNPEWLAAARALAKDCLSHESGGLVYGECSPRNVRSMKGCCGVDNGYNAEETLPCLCRAAAALNDKRMLNACERLFRAQLEWMLPDGAWDDSFGTRSFKWTYWGSRTADGCQDALFFLGRRDPVFASAALRSLRLLKGCTHGGLLAGGPDYAEAGEKICVHHTFCRAKSLAAALDAGFYEFENAPLPAERAAPLRHFPQTDTYRLANRGYIADITGYDVKYKTAGHVSGGAASLLWHPAAGPLMAAGMAKDSLFEPHNQQLPANPAMHKNACMRVETPDGLYSQHFDFSAKLNAMCSTKGPAVRADAVFCDETGAPAPGGGSVAITYLLAANGLFIRVNATRAFRLVLPVTPAGRVSVLRGKREKDPEKGYNLTPGLLFYEYAILPDDGLLALVKIEAGPPTDFV